MSDDRNRSPHDRKEQDNDSGLGEATAPGVPLPARMLSPQEEDRLFRKIDRRLLPTLTVLYLLCFMDRANIGQHLPCLSSFHDAQRRCQRLTQRGARASPLAGNAKLDGLIQGLDMSSADFQVALSVFFVSFCLCELLSNLMLIKLRPRVWLPSIVVGWSIVMTLMGVVQTKGGLYATRFLLGLTEAG